MTGSATVTVNPLPAAFTVTGGGGYCAGGTGADVGLGGSVTGVSYQLFTGGTPIGAAQAGTASAIDFGLQVTAGIYTVTGTVAATGCTRIMTGSVTVTVNPIPVISGGTAVCIGATLPESPPGGGTWSSSTPLVATINTATGSVTGVATGTTGITYTTAAGCSANTVVTVSPSPGPIGGPGSVCVGASDTELNSVPGGVWTSTPATTATIGSLTGVVTGAMAGTLTITYSLGSGCTVMRVMTVTAAPGAISGSSALCSGAGTLLSDGTGGTWSSSNTAAATVGSTGSVSGILPGTTTIIYTLGGCTSMHVVTVSAAPGAITGAATVCAGSEITLSDGGGGTWTSSNTGVATVDGSGDVWGANGGTATIAYSLGGGLRGHKGDNSERRIGYKRGHRAVHRHGNAAGGHPCGHVAERQYVCSHGERHRRCWRGGLRDGYDHPYDTGQAARPPRQ